MKCYKIVKNTGEELVSCIVPKGIAQLTYAPKKKTTANPLLIQAGYGICTFRTQKAARNFLNFNLGWNNIPTDHMQVWEADGTGRMQIPSQAAAGKKLKVKSLKGFLQKVAQAAYSFFPDDTLMFESITLIKKEDKI